MKIGALVLLLITTCVVKAQQISIGGQVIDSETKRPVASVTISIVKKNLFYPANSTGKFEITTNKIINTDSIAFSCIGYQTRKIKAGDITPDAVIEISRIINLLREVRISNTRTIKVGTKKESSRISWAPIAGYELAMFMDGSKNVSGTIQTVSFYLSDGRGMFKGGDVTAPFRVRLFGVDTNGYPGRELTKEIIIVSAKKNRKWLEVDISPYNIQNPDSGFYAAFSLLTYDYYLLKKGAPIPEKDIGPIEGSISIAAKDVIGPRLGVIAHKTRQSRSFLSVERSLQDWTWHWVRDYFNWEYMIRATIAPK